MHFLKYFSGLIIVLFMFSACNVDGNIENKVEDINPLLSDFQTPFEVPPFDLIKNKHFQPAMEEGMRHHNKEIETIANNQDEPTFENTIAALDNAGELLNRVLSIFNNINSAHTNDEIQEIAKEMAPALSSHNDNIYLNEQLFSRVKKVYDDSARLNLNPEQGYLLKKTYKNFIRSGANLTDADKIKLRNINSKIATFTLEFGQNVLAETNKFQLIIDKKEDLAGLSPALVETAEEEAKASGKGGKYVFTLHNASVMPFLQYADNRELRKQIWEAYMKRGDNNDELDNKEIILELANLRREKAQLLGYKNHAHYVLEESMAKTPENVYKLLDKLWTPALAIAKKEEADMQKLIEASGENFKLQPYDWRYYTEKVRKTRFNLDEEEIKPYFSLNNVKEGIFKVSHKLYGLTFKELKDIPKYHNDVTVYEVKEADGSHVGILYMDFHPRASKRGGAWMTSYRSQKMENGKRKAPVISIVCNFSKPTANAPALLTFDEVTTFFHEFGHALHGLLSNVQFKSLAGTAVSRDFVELPSQIMENWAEEPEVMKMFALHYKTGEVIPDELIEKIKKSGTFNQGFATTEYLAASLLDLDFHTQEKQLNGDVNEFEKTSMIKLNLMESIIPRYRSTYFNHIFSGGYSSGYYSYIWSGVLDTDAFEAFKETSLFDQEQATKFRKTVLERGDTKEPMELYVDFRGREPEIGPLLRKRGLDQYEKIVVR
jgi:peptidyl-dipeptidase Dcp